MCKLLLINNVLFSDRNFVSSRYGIGVMRFSLYVIKLLIYDSIILNICLQRLNIAFNYSYITNNKWTGYVFSSLKIISFFILCKVLVHILLCPRTWFNMCISIYKWFFYQAWYTRCFCHVNRHERDPYRYAMD